MESNLEKMVQKGKIRLIPEVLFLDGPTNMAVHEYLTTLEQPALVISHFVPPAVTFGKGVHVDSLPELCRKGTIAAVRRKTGGEILYHARTDVTYAFTGMTEDTELNVTKAKLFSIRCLINGLDRIGLTTYSRRGTSIFVRVGDKYKKISGSAPLQDVGRPFMIHGSIFYDKPDFELLSKLYGYSVQELQDYITWVRAHKDVSVESVHEAVRIGFLHGRQYEARSLDRYDWGKIEKIAKKFASGDHYRGTGTERPGQACAMTHGSHEELKDIAPKYIPKERIIDE